jgi:hypothetical protein
VAFLRATSAGFALALALGCASAPARERTVLAGGWAQTLLILPLNVPAVMAPELEAARAAVWEELEIYLRAQGKELKTVAFPTARQLWLAAMRKVRSGEKGSRAGFDEAAQAFVLELARHADFDGVIVPSLFVREARIAGTRARWDGVERALEFEVQGRAGEAAPGPPPAGGVPAGDVVAAASFHAVVLDAQGRKIQEALRGLDLLVRVRVSEPAGGPDGTGSLEYATRPDPLADRAHVRDAIAGALAPFLPRSDAPAPGPS